MQHQLPSQRNSLPTQTATPPPETVSSLAKTAIEALLRQEKAKGPPITYWRFPGGPMRRITPHGPEGLPLAPHHPVPNPLSEPGRRPTDQHTITCGPHPVRHLAAAPLLCAENHQKFYQDVALYPDAGTDGMEQQHAGLVHPCANRSEHANEAGGEHFVCEACIYDTEQYLRQHRRKLLRPAFLPLCDRCAIESLTVEQIECGYDGCVCPREPGRGAWLCFECRYKELNLARAKKEVEEDTRRDLVGVEVVEGEVVRAFIGLMCWCGAPVGTVKGAERCAGCLGFFQKAMGKWC